MEYIRSTYEQNLITFCSLTLVALMFLRLDLMRTIKLVQAKQNQDCSVSSGRLL